MTIDFSKLSRWEYDIYLEGYKAGMQKVLELAQSQTSENKKSVDKSKISDILKLDS